ELHQSGLGASGAADDTDDLSALNMKVHILQRQVAVLPCIAEVHMFKINIPVRHLCQGILFIHHLRHFLKHLFDTVRRSLSNHDHDKDKGYHHQGHEDLHGIYHDTCKLTCHHISKHNVLSSNENNEEDHCVHDKVHNRGVPRHQLLSLCEQIKHFQG